MPFFFFLRFVPARKFFPLSFVYSAHESPSGNRLCSKAAQGGQSRSSRCPVKRPLVHQLAVVGLPQQHEQVEPRQRSPRRTHRRGALSAHGRQRTGNAQNIERQVNALRRIIEQAKMRAVLQNVRIDSMARLQRPARERIVYFAVAGAQMCAPFCASETQTAPLCPFPPGVCG